jgi:hypothetical protein
MTGLPAAAEKYDPGMSEGARKVRKTLTLDPDIVEAFGGDNQALSATVNEVLRVEVERRQKREALGRFVAELEEKWGPADPDEVERFRRALS